MITVLSVYTEGNFLYKFGMEEDGNGELDEPRHLSIDKNGNLIVCDCENHRVQIFNLNGMFLSTVLLGILMDQPPPQFLLMVK